MQKTYDILIVGAGPAGSTAAYEAAKEGAKVFLIDKKRMIGHPVQCAEYIPKLICHEVSISENCIAQKIRGMKTYVPQGDFFETISPGFILHRECFDHALTSKAEEEGVALQTNTVCISRNGHKITIDEQGTRREIIPKIIIGADGPHSTVGTWMQSCNRDFIYGLQYMVPLVASLQQTEVYFKDEFFGGYGWLFPKGPYANVGIGVKLTPNQIKKNTLVMILENFIQALETLEKIKSIPLVKSAGFIPVGGPLNTVRDNMVLVGDAAGQTHPITGGGIPQAIICGKIAGKSAAKAVREGSTVLKEYEKQWRSVFGAELKRAKMKRNYLESNWHNLHTIIKKCWPAFREYYEN